METNSHDENPPIDPGADASQQAPGGPETGSVADGPEEQVDAVQSQPPAPTGWNRLQVITLEVGRWVC